MNPYDKPVPFPIPYVPEGNVPNLSDPFGNLARTVPEVELGTPGPAGPPGGGGGMPDLDVVRAVDGSVIASGTDTLTISGKNIVWVQLNVNVNGTAGYMLVLGSLGYTTPL